MHAEGEARLKPHAWPGARAAKRGVSGGTEFVSYPELMWFEELVTALEPELRRFIAHRVRSACVDDVLQEVRIAAWQALPAFDGRSKPRTWLYGICYHKCQDQYRSQRGELRHVPIEDLALIDPAPSAELTAERIDTVTRLLASLDEDHRVVLELYYYAQLTLAEIASILERNLNTVKYQFYRAHSNLLAAGEEAGLR